jgi:hypothetical protein
MNDGPDFANVADKDLAAYHAFLNVFWLGVQRETRSAPACAARSGRKGGEWLARISQRRGARPPRCRSRRRQ